MSPPRIPSQVPLRKKQNPQWWYHQAELFCSACGLCSTVLIQCFSAPSLSLSFSLLRSKCSLSLFLSPYTLSPLLSLFPLCVWPSPPPPLLPLPVVPSFSFCGFVFPPSGVQMTILVIAVKPPLWPVSTVCPFLLPVCLSVCVWLSVCSGAACWRWDDCMLSVCLSVRLSTPYCVSILCFVDLAHQLHGNHSSQMKN